MKCLTRLLIQSALLLLLLLGCRVDPNWQALYEEKLGQPITELNETALNSDFMDQQGNLTRVSWAQLADGTRVMLGLPAHGNPPAAVVERTVVLREEEWKQSCLEALGRPAETVSAWGWGVLVENGIGNTITVHFSGEPANGSVSIILPDPAEPYCQFVFLPEGWELRLVQSQGIIKTE